MDTTRVTIREARFAGSIGMERVAPIRVFHEMTGADTTLVIVRGERFAGGIGMERAALGRVSRGTTPVMVTTTATKREIRSACPVGKDRHATDA